MKVYLIRYRRTTGKLEGFTVYRIDQREEARSARLQIELTAMRAGEDIEAVLLEAPSEERLRETHGRYFKSFGELDLAV